MHTEWTLTERHVDHVDDRFGDIGPIDIGGGGSGETLHNVVAEVCVRAVVVLGLTCLVCRRACVGEVVGAGGEGAGNDDGGLDAPAIEFCSVADSERIHSCLRRKVG